MFGLDRNRLSNPGRLFAAVKIHNRRASEKGTDGGDDTATMSCGGVAYGSGERGKVAVGLVDIGLVPVDRGVIAFAAGLVGNDHDQHAVFAVEVRGLGQPHGSVFVDLRLEGLDHGGKLSRKHAVSNPMARAGRDPHGLS